MDDLTVKIESSFENLTNIREEWDKLVIDIDGDFYMSYDWCRIWWKHYGSDRKLQVFLFREKEELVGIAPMFTECLRLGPVWLNVGKVIGSSLTVCEPPIKKAWAQQIFKRIIEHLIIVSGCDAILFGPLLNDRGNVQELQKTYKGQSEIVNIEYERKFGPQTYVKLPDSLDDFLSTLGRRTRQYYRNDFRKLSSTYDVVVDVIKEGQFVENEFEHFISMHQNQWQRLGKAGHFKDWPNIREFHFDLLRSQVSLGRLRLLRLLANNQVIAYIYAYVLGGCYYLYLMAREAGPEWDKYGTGRLIILKTYENAIKEGIYRIDLGKEHSDYKTRLGGEEFPVQSVFLVANNGWVRTRCSLFRLLSDALNIVYYKIWACRLAPRLNMRNKPFWNTWIRSRL